MSNLVVVFASLALLSVTAGHSRDFPDGFMFGASSAAYMVEGAWNVSDKSESILDRYYHENPTATTDGNNGDVASDAYNLYLEDVKIAKELGLTHYRFSIQWSRILPTGFPNYISKDGVNYYNNLINALLENGIEPIVSLYYWDLPQILQDFGGWVNPLVSDWFADYSRVAFSIFGDRVKIWNTICEPLISCAGGYQLGLSAPGIADKDFAYLQCVKNSLVAHGKAYRVYEKEFKEKYNGKLAMVNQFIWFEPQSEEFTELTKTVRDFSWGMFLHPIYSKNGGWPPAIEKFFAQKSKEQGYTRSRLPAFTCKEIQIVKGSFDFLAVNYFTSRQVRATLPTDTPDQTFWPTRGAPDFGATFVKDPSWQMTDSIWFEINPAGFSNMLKWLKEEYGDIEMIITENGYSNDQVDIQDPERIMFMEMHMEEMLKAIYDYDVNVTGYIVSTLHDNFEWTDGFVMKFGLYAIDFASAEKTRTARESAKYFTKVIKANSLDV